MTATDYADLVKRLRASGGKGQYGRVRWEAADALAQARRTIDKRVTAYHELAEDYVRVTAERDEAVRAIADERERCAKVGAVITQAALCVAPETWPAGNWPLADALVSLREALDEFRALPLHALAGGEEMPDRKDTRDELREAE